MEAVGKNNRIVVCISKYSINEQRFAGEGSRDKIGSSGLEEGMRSMPCASRRKPVMVGQGFSETTFSGTGRLNKKRGQG